MDVIPDRRGPDHMHVSRASAAAKRRARAAAAGVSFAGLLDAVPDALLAIDANGIVRYGNAHAERMFGYAHAELVGRAAELLLPDTSHASLIGHTAADLRCRGRRRDDSELIVEAKVRRVHDDGGVVALLVVRQVREVRDDYRQLLETSVVGGVWIIDADGRTTFANARMAEIVGASAEELVGRSFLDFVPEEEREHAVELFDRRRSGVCEVHDFRLHRRDGSELWTRVATTPLVDEHGCFAGAFAMVTDTTQAKQAEQKLAESENLLRAVIDGTTDAVFVKDRDGRYVFVNRGAARATGTAPENMLGKDDTAVFAGETARRLRANDVEVMRSGKTATYEEDATASDGARHTYSSTKAPWHGATGEVIGIIGIARDVTERLRSAEEDRLLADVSDVLARSIDFESTLQGVANVVVPRLADWSFLHLIDEGTFHSTVAHQDGARLAIARRLLQLYRAPRMEPPSWDPRSRVLRTGKPEAGPVTEELLDGIVDSAEQRKLLREWQLRFYMSVPLLARGRAIGVLTLVSVVPGRRYEAQDIAVAAEIARRAAMAIESARLYRDARRAIVARNDLLAMVSHDLRNPLNVLNLRANLLLGQWPDRQPGRAHVEAIQRAALRMAGLTAELLDAASLEAGHVVLERVPCEPGALVDEVLEQFGPMIERKELRLRRLVEPRLPTLSCDRDRLGRVLANLVDNAIKFTAGGGTLTVRAELRGREVWFGVADTGAGIPDDQLQHIFDRYSQPGGAARGGAGLGLFIAKGIVDAHGGTIAAESLVGSGTTVGFTIPVEPGAGAGAGA